MENLKKYKKFVGAEKLGQIHERAEKLGDKHILNINSTYQGGGVAVILNSLIPLMNNLGIDVGWRILHGPPDFFITTKKFYNAIQGEKIHFTKQKQKIYLENCERFSSFTHIHHDAVIIHDIQPLPLVKFYKKRQPWIWRCHSDASHPNKEVFNYLKKNFINHYDYSVFLSKKFLQPGLKPKQVIMQPSIDPLDIKNKELTERTVNHYLNKFGVPTDKPLVCQVSRFDKWKDHFGMIKIFKKVREKVDCRLVLIGCMALDDPMGQQIYEKIIKKVSGQEDIIILNVVNDILVNALQRKASVIIQKSIMEGFGLTVSEALWKGTPVVASNVGGITEQIINGKNGYLLSPYDFDGFAARIVKLLKDSKLRATLGKQGRETVKNKFLITTHLLNWINLLNQVFEKEKKAK
ncbi:MAG: glycosyltransferase [Candidatus Pacearchaeota archaeon]|nr:MAG: glycosyltransferase [Candidatus Pacearchaeota archaeon]